jgi:hypothetical protein
MDSIYRRLAVEEEDEVTAYPGPICGEGATPAQLDALYGAFPGITIYADPVAKSLSGLAASDPDAALVCDDTRVREQTIRGRWAGIRDPLGEHHPIAVRLRSKLKQRPEAVPEPEPAIAGALEALGCVRVGRIVTFRGVPVPAGEAQTA